MVARFFLIASFLLGLFCVQGQQRDYMKLRDKLVTFTCGPAIDSSDVYSTIRRLEALDTTSIKKNMHEYYEDLANAYWLASNGNTAFLQKAIRANHAALHHKENNTNSYWALGMAYYMAGDCSRMKHYLELYKKYLPKKFQSEEDDRQVNALISDCK